ncbi:hypothetical protein, conserved [Plasmodium gonderi]|uniref:Uncharacterized protein n=1 Tax=Plasmodium gonderi TaxID=77519 RepID=A0A1Y1JBV4_PLAGO|nr:hypothetical protein, conserved [Plasmodium gonderi]GAW80011.1 hypothetical protein, conserved [Plasmodium gonderi]
MKAEKRGETLIVNESILCIKRYFDLHDSTVISINELIKIIIQKNESPITGFDETEEFEDLVKNELTYAFIKEFEAVKLTLIELKACINEMKRLNGIIDEAQYDKAISSSGRCSNILLSLRNFFKSTLTHFRRDYMLKKKLHEALIHVDSSCENEINRLQLMWKETPFLFTILHKHKVNKLIMECKQFLQKP